MADQKISALSAVTVVDSTDEFAVNQGGSSKKVTVAQLKPVLGQFLSANTARVDPSGDDGTGTIGDLAKPFLTVQAALTAFETDPNGDGTGKYPDLTVALIDIGNNRYSEDLTTSLNYVNFRGVDQDYSYPFNSITFTSSTARQVGIFFCAAGNIAADATTGIFGVQIEKAYSGDVSIAAGDADIYSESGSGWAAAVTCGKTLTYQGLFGDHGPLTSTTGDRIDISRSDNGYPQDYINPLTVDSPGSTVNVFQGVVAITACEDLNLVDSRPYGSTAGVTGTITYSDTFLAPHVDASGFDGNLTTSDDTLQAVAQKVDDLTLTGGVTSVTGTAPIASSGGATPAISIGAATTGASGSMSAADKTKLDGLSNGIGTVTGVFDGAGSALTTGNTGIPWTAPYAGTITGWNISVDTGTATFKVWKKADGTAIPTISDVINTSGVAISTGTHVRSSTTSDFTTTTVTAGDQFIIALTTVAAATKAILEVEITR